MIEPKDVVLAVMGASAALGGFVLVFLGVIIAAYQSYPASVPEEVVKPYRATGIALYTAFAISLVTVAASLFWLLAGGSTGLFDLAIVLFILQMVAVLIAAGRATRMVLWQ